jgi:hypothetical protein
VPLPGKQQTVPVADHSVYGEPLVQSAGADVCSQPTEACGHKAGSVADLMVLLRDCEICLELHGNGSHAQLNSRAGTRSDQRSGAYTCGLNCVQHLFRGPQASLCSCCQLSEP